MKDLKFNKPESHFVWRGELTDMFSDYRLLTVNFTIDELTQAFIGIRWTDGVDYLLDSAAVIKCPEEEYPCSGVITLEWEAEPTIANWLNALGEPIPKTTTKYDHTEFITGYLIGQEGYVTDMWDTKLLVETAEIPWNIIVSTAAIGIVGTTALGLHYEHNPAGII